MSGEGNRTVSSPMTTIVVPSVDYANGEVIFWSARSEKVIGHSEGMICL